MTMTSRERVRTALRHHQPDRCPVDFGGTAMSQCLPEFLAKMRAALGFPMPPDREADDDWADERILRYLEVDLRLVPYQPPLPVLRDMDPEACTRVIADRQRKREEAAAGVNTPGRFARVSAGECHARRTEEDARAGAARTVPLPGLADRRRETFSGRRIRHHVLGFLRIF